MSGSLTGSFKGSGTDPLKVSGLQFRVGVHIVALGLRLYGFVFLYLAPGVGGGLDLVARLGRFWGLLHPTVNSIKLETRLWPNSAGIPFAFLLRIEAIGCPTLGLLL